MKKFYIFIIVFIIVFLDQISKFIFKDIHISIMNLFSINYTKNYGAAFGILSRGNILLILISIFVIIFILYYLRKINKTNLQLSLSFILAGAIGNLIDRIFLGYVIDFIDFKIWPVFNIADIFNTVGAILLIYFLLKYK